MGDLLNLSRTEKEILENALSGGEKGVELHTRMQAFLAITRCAEKLCEEMKEEILDEKINHETQANNRENDFKENIKSL